MRGKTDFDISIEEQLKDSGFKKRFDKAGR
jgi:hypothetical protein